MSDQAATAASAGGTGLAARRHRRGMSLAVVTGIAAASAYGRGALALLSGVLSGQPAFAPVERFDVTHRRVRVAAAMPGLPDLLTEVTGAVRDACDDAGLSRSQRARTPLFLAIHGDPAMPRAGQADKSGHGPEAFTAAVASRCGLAEQGIRCYMSACVSASSATADAAALIARGQADRVVVAGGYLVEPDQFALFDAGRVLADDGRVRPFSAGRRGILLGDGVGAVVVESHQAALTRQAPALIRLAGWGRSGDAHHPCEPHPEGLGLARAAVAALQRAGITAGDLGYINAHGSGTSHSDPAETNALRLALGDAVAAIPVSSTKSLHGQALEASGVLELIVTLLAIRKGMLPVNAGFLGADAGCRLSLVLCEALTTTTQFAMSLNSAFGGANTALVIGLP
jgi:3-oxoacyl-[acyl-carrier-protein] synthase II